MGCCSSSSAAEPQKKNEKSAEQKAADAEAVSMADAEHKQMLTVEGSKEVAKENFEKGLKLLLNLAIDGHPKALRSIAAVRNKRLREFQGDQDAAAESVKENTKSWAEEGREFLLGLIPGVGLPAALIYPMWKNLRRMCLTAAIFGLNMADEKVRAKILYAFIGMSSVEPAEMAIGFAVQAVWKKLAGPVAGLVPVGTLVGGLANVEDTVYTHGHIKEALSDGRRKIPESEYMQELDPEITAADYAELVKQGGIKAAEMGFDLASKGIAKGIDAATPHIAKGIDAAKQLAAPKAQANQA